MGLTPFAPYSPEIEPMKHNLTNQNANLEDLTYVEVTLKRVFLNKDGSENCIFKTKSTITDSASIEAESFWQLARIFTEDHRFSNEEIVEILDYLVGVFNSLPADQ